MDHGSVFRRPPLACSKLASIGYLLVSRCRSRHPDAAIIVPPRSTMVPIEAAETAPTRRDRHLRDIAEHGRTARQVTSGYTRRARAGTAVPRLKLVIGDALRSQADERRATDVEVAIHVLDRMLDLGRPNSARIA